MGDWSWTLGKHNEPAKQAEIVAGRRPPPSGRLPGRGVVAAVGGAPGAAVGPGAGCAVRRGLLRPAPARGGPGLAAGPVRLRRPSSATSPRGRTGSPDRSRNGRAMGGRPGQGQVGAGHLDPEKGATDVASRTAAAVGEAPRSLRHFNALCRTPGQAQDRLLRQILEANADTEFGRRHGFGAIATFRDYQERVQQLAGREIACDKATGRNHDPVWSFGGLLQL
jgi:hypothetical protein